MQSGLQAVSPEWEGGSNDLNSQIMQALKKGSSTHLGQVDFPAEQVPFHLFILTK